jgi:MFS family permease
MHSPGQTLSTKQVLLCGALIVTLSMGIRHGFGLWLQPITQEQGWTRQTFSLAIAIQNLSWGVMGVFAGMLADKLGAFRVLWIGALLYALGLAGMAWSPTPLLFALTAGVLIGAAQAGTTYAVIYGVIGRQIPAERRSWAMGVAAAAGSFGQFLMVPIEGQLIAQLGWHNALMALAAVVLLIVPLALGLREPRRTPSVAGSVHRAGGARRGLRPRPPPALVRAARPPGHRCRPRRRGARRRAGAGRDRCRPTSRTALALAGGLRRRGRHQLPVAALLPTIVASVAPGGVLLYETFAQGNETVGKPSRPDFLLRPGELLEACRGCAWSPTRTVSSTRPPRFVQRIAAVRVPAGTAPARYPL